MKRFGQYFWPRSLYAQILLTVALALLVAQSINAVLLLGSIRNRSVIESATMLTGRVGNYIDRQAGNAQQPSDPRNKKHRRHLQAIGVIRTSQPLTPDGYQRQPELEQRAREFLNQADTGLTDIRFSKGPIAALPAELSEGPLHRLFVERLRREGHKLPREGILLSVRNADGQWFNAANIVRPRESGSILAMIVQTILIYIAIMIPLALIAGRIAKPLARLTARVDQVGSGSGATPLASQGPSDVRRLIDAFNGMQARVGSLLGEKDVMLGAIGHDLKTPLAALRVRVESVENGQERAKMVATIDEMVTILDDILMLARLGKSGEPTQRTDIGALVESVLEEFATSGTDIGFTPSIQRVVAPVRAVLIRRALRNVIGNALDYGKYAAVSMQHDGKNALIIIDDNGPGIAADKVEAMFEPFVRAEASRNRDTGGSGLGLTIARAILRSHNGDIRLENRPMGGLRAVIALPTE
jgi:signal transduction histidine kinase